MSARRTPLHARHLAAGAKMVDFAGWEMPIQYSGGIVEEHLATRRGAGLFDVSHMGRIVVTGPGAAALLDACLTNDAAALAVGRAQYTILPTESGGALDDAFLYRPGAEEYLLVVNASNRERDWERLRGAAAGRATVSLADRTEELAMVSVQGPRSLEVLERACGAPLAPDLRRSRRNTVHLVSIAGSRATLVRTGYAGEPVGFELIVPGGVAGEVWDLLAGAGATPVGLGARDTLRLEAGLPLYGHELGQDPEGREIPLLACAQARGAVRLSARKEGLPGRAALEAQQAVWDRVARGEGDAHGEPRRLVRQLTLLEPGVARGGARIVEAAGERPLGWITSGTVVPAWVFVGAGAAARPTDATERRAALLGLVDREVRLGAEVGVEVRGRVVRALVVERLLDPSTPPYALPVRPRV